MKNLLYGFRKFKNVVVLSDYSFLVFLLRRFGCFSLFRDCVDADKGSRAGIDRESKFFAGGNYDGFPQRGGNKRRDSLFSNCVAKNTIIGVAVFIAFIVSVVFSFFSVLYVLG
jgi:hypothetical protein